MPSSYSSLLRLEEQAPGEGLNTWGSNLNGNTTALIDFSIAGRTALTPSGPITLTSNNGSADQARSAIIDCTSGTGGTITIPSVSHVYQVRNNCSGNVVFTTGSGTTATVEPGNLATVFCDGTNCYRFADAADIAACLASAESYANGLAFQSSSGNLPGQAGNAGKYLVTNGTNANWQAIQLSDVTTALGYTPQNPANPAPTATALATARVFSMTGDATGSFTAFDGSAAVSAAVTLATVNSNVGSFTNANITVNAKGLITAAANGSAGGLFQGANSQSGNYTAVLGDANKIIWMTGNSHTFTIPANASVAFPIGTVFRVVQTTGNSNSIAVTSDTLFRMGSGMPGSITMSGANSDLVDVTKIGTTTWIGTSP